MYLKVMVKILEFQFLIFLIIYFQGIIFIWRVFIDRKERELDFCYQFFILKIIWVLCVFSKFGYNEFLIDVYLNCIMECN